MSNPPPRASVQVPMPGVVPTTGGSAAVGVTELARVPIGELAERCGIRLLECTPDRVTATMPVVGNRQPFDLLHGGASGVLAETIGSVHANLLAGPGRFAVGLELNCTHHRSVVEGLVTAVSTPLHVGRTIASFHIAIADESGRATCTARLTCMTRSAQSERPREVSHGDDAGR